MIRSALGPAWYRARATFRRRLTGYLTIVVLIGLLGGLALGAIAGARRTQSSYTTYIASTNPADLGGISSILNPAIGGYQGYDAKVISEIRHLPLVKVVASASGLDVLPLKANGTPLNLASFPAGAGNGLGSVDGEGFSMDRLTVIAGRMANPNRANEIMMQSLVAEYEGFHVGQRIRIGIYTNAQTQLAGFGTARVHPYRTMVVTLVGIANVPRQLIEDDADESVSLALFTPAFTDPLVKCCANYTETGVQAVGGLRNAARVASEISKFLPSGFPPMTSLSSQYGKAQRAIEPESIALATFGAIAALAALLIAAQLIGRQLRLASGELETMRALGADPRMTASDGLIPILGSVLIGSLLAVVVAIGLSPLTPIGPVGPVYPYPGVAFDWTVLGFGLLCLVVILAAVAIVLAWRSAPHRRRGALFSLRRSPLVGAATRLGLPAPAVAGIRFAAEPGSGVDAVPVRSSVLGAALAIVVVVGTLVFGTSLDGLVSHPARYGWNWNYVLVGGGGSGDIPQSTATKLLAKDRYVKAWSGAYSAVVTIDGQIVPVLAERAGAPVQPPTLSGHNLASKDEVVLGAITLAQLHKQVGDTVRVTTGSNRTVYLRIVGTAALPAIGSTPGHLEMATGAVMDSRLISPALKNPFNDPTTGPEYVFVDLKSGAPKGAALRSLDAMGGPLTNNFNFGVDVSSVLRPAEIVNYRSMGTTPAILGGALAAGAVAALAITLVASVHRRRRDLALLKTLGFTQRQLASTVAWQSSIAVLAGTIVGIPVGIALGRWLWDVFAHQIHVVAVPEVPAILVALIGVGGLVLANVVAAVPGRIAGRTSTALVLRSE